MTKCKRLTAVLLSVIMIVCCFGVQASAASVYDKAVKLSPLDLVSAKTIGTNNKDYYYKIVLSDSGKLTFGIESGNNKIKLDILDSS